MSSNQSNGGNPFYGISVGSTVHEADGSFSAPVIQEGMTRFAAGSEGTIRMSGNSSFMYSDSMNQGSFGVSGSYGVKGVSQYTAAVSAYVGNTNASNSRSTSLSIDLMTWAGIEYIDFNNLTVTELVSGLSENPQAYLLNALDKFNAMRVADSEALAAATNAWIVACEEFYARQGTGIVVGVLWGAYGSVNLTFTSKADENKWQYGGDASFTYAGTGASVAVSAAYGGSQSSIAEAGSASVEAYYSGSSVQKEISAWAQQYMDLANKGLAELGKQKVTRNAELSNNSSAPKVPDFVKPNKKSKVTDLVSQIKDLNGLETYAIAAAYEKYKADGGEGDLDAFMISRAEANDIAGLVEEPVAPDLNAPHNQPNPDMNLRREPQGFLSKTKATLKSEKLTASPQDEFVPMGLWIASWSNLFPWLVSGHDNRIPKDAQATDTIRLRTYIQDCRSLENIYHTVYTSGSTIVDVNFRALRDAFGHAAFKAIDVMRDLNNVDVQAKLHALISELSQVAHKIYSVWVDNPILREYQLGGGLYATDERGKAYGSLSSLKFAPSPISHNVMTFKNSGFEIDKAPLNTEAFAQDIKGRPVILPDGNIVVFLTNGEKDSSGFLGGDRDIVNGFDIVLSTSKKIQTEYEWENFLSAIPFKVTSKGLEAVGRIPMPWPDKKELLLGYPGIYHLIPIPFSAANGVDWRFGATTTGTGNLQSQLDKLRDDLKNRPQWSLDSDHWKGFTWSDNAFSLREIKPSYIGITEEVKNIFGSR